MRGWLGGIEILSGADALTAYRFNTGARVAGSTRTTSGARTQASTASTSLDGGEPSEGHGPEGGDRRRAAVHSPDNAKKFRQLVTRVDDIQEAYSLTGDADYVLKAVLRDLKSLSDIVNNVPMPHPSVAHVRSSIVLDRLKESGKLPLRS